MALKDKLHTLQQTNNKGTISFFSKTISGYFIVIDGKKRIQEIGSHGEASLMLASWAMQYENYRCEVFARLAKPAYVIPIISEKVSYWFPTTTGALSFIPVFLAISFQCYCNIIYLHHVLVAHCLDDDLMSGQTLIHLLIHPLHTPYQNTPCYNTSSNSERRRYHSS